MSSARGCTPHVRSVVFPTDLVLAKEIVTLLAYYSVSAPGQRAVRRIHDYWAVSTYAVAHVVDVKEVTDDKITCVGVTRIHQEVGGGCQ